VTISCSRFVVHIVFGFCYSLPSLRIVFVVLDFLLGHLGFRLLELRKGIIVELRLKSLRSFQTLSKTLGGFYFMCFRFTVLLLCIIILAWNCHSLELFTRNQKSNQQGLEHCPAFDKGFSLHRTICTDDRRV
jgi:SNF family Na+-dependent transporter